MADKFDGIGMAETAVRNGDAVVQLATLVKQTYGRNSLTRRAQDTIAQFPVIMSAAIPIEDAAVIAKAIEAQYAALLVSVISMNSDYDRGQYKNAADYIKSFHNNSNVPTLFQTIDSYLPDDTVLPQYALESARTLYSLEHLVSQDVVMECWDDGMSCFNTGSLNATYRPHERTQDAMEAVASSLRGLQMPAMENLHKDDIGARKGKEEHKFEKYNDKGKLVKRNTTSKTLDPAVTGKQEVVRNQQLTALEPTLINLQLNSHHGAGGTVITHNIVMGVKTKIQQVPQQFMVSNLIEGVNDSRGIFKFLRWLMGDYKIGRDLILGVDNAKDEARGNKDMKSWIKAIRRRKMGNIISRTASGESMPPLTTVVTTSYEVAKVAEATGFDLSDAYVAMKLISKYYLLGFIIYDVETQRIQSLFDGDVAFSMTTLSSARGKQSKDIDLVTMTNILRAMK